MAYNPNARAFNPAASLFVMPTAPSAYGNAAAAPTATATSSAAATTAAAADAGQAAVAAVADPATAQANPAAAATSAEGGAPAAAPAAPAAAVASVDDADAEEARAAAARVKAEAEARREAEAQARREAEARRESEAAAAAKREALAKARAEADAENEVRAMEKYRAQRQEKLQALKSSTPPVLPHINVVGIGHVDAGKSTITGQLLVLSGAVDDRVLQKYEKEASEKAGSSWLFAYIMDTNEEERAKGKTVEVGRAYFETPNRRVTILDAPGHNNYVPNMIMGTAQADVAMLVVSARKGEFEAGFEKSGQTREHTVLAKTMGVQKAIVVINKMDDMTVAWSKERYDEILAKLKPFLRSVNYNVDNDVTFLPISGFHGDNLKLRSTNPAAQWYSGPTLLEIFDAIQITGRISDAPTRLPVMDKYKDAGTVVVMGKLESGTIAKGDKLVAMPSKQSMEVVGIETDAPVPEVDFIEPGENVRLLVSGIEPEVLHTGDVLCSPDSLCHVVDAVEAQLMIIELLPGKPVLSAGYACVMHCSMTTEEVTVTHLVNELDKKTRQPVVPRPKFVRSGANVIVRLKFAKPVCIEKFDEFAAMGRFALRDEGKTIALGRVQRIAKSASGGGVAS